MYQPHLETSFSQAPRDRSVIIACRFKAADHRPVICLQNFHQPVMLRTIVEDLQPTAMLWPGSSIRTSLRTLAISMATYTAS